MLLATYLTNVRDILNDPNAMFYSDALLTRFINRARVRVAKRSQCVRKLTPGSAAITSTTQVAGGSGYTSPPTVTITGPDMIQGPSWTQATATANLTGNAVSSLTLTNAGTGYVKAPTITFSGGGGTGASFTATLGTHYTTTAGTEVYTLAGAATSLASAGVAGVVDILDLAIAYSGIKPTLSRCDWPTFQSFARSYGTSQQYPALWSSYARGESGSYYLFPVPSDQYAIEADCICTPADLSGGQTIDLIPDAWTEAVFYYSAKLAYENAQRRDDAKSMGVEHEMKLREAAENTGSILVPSYYASGD